MTSEFEDSDEDFWGPADNNVSRKMDNKNVSNAGSTTDAQTRLVPNNNDPFDFLSNDFGVSTNGFELKSSTRQVPMLMDSVIFHNKIAQATSSSDPSLTDTQLAKHLAADMSPENSGSSAESPKEIDLENDTVHCLAKSYAGPSLSQLETRLTQSSPWIQKRKKAPSSEELAALAARLYPKEYDTPERPKFTYLKKREPASTASPVQKQGTIAKSQKDSNDEDLQRPTFTYLKKHEHTQPILNASLPSSAFQASVNKGMYSGYTSDSDLEPPKGIIPALPRTTAPQISEKTENVSSEESELSNGGINTVENSLPVSKITPSAPPEDVAMPLAEKIDFWDRRLSSSAGSVFNAQNTARDSDDDIESISEEIEVAAPADDDEFDAKFAQLKHDRLAALEETSSLDIQNEPIRASPSKFARLVTTGDAASSGDEAGRGHGRLQSLDTPTAQRRQLGNVPNVKESLNPFDDDFVGDLQADNLPSSKIELNSQSPNSDIAYSPAGKSASFAPTSYQINKPPETPSSIRTLNDSNATSLWSTHGSSDFARSMSQDETANQSAATFVPKNADPHAINNNNFTAIDHDTTAMQNDDVFDIWDPTDSTNNNPEAKWQKLAYNTHNSQQITNENNNNFANQMDIAGSNRESNDHDEFFAQKSDSETHNVLVAVHNIAHDVDEIDNVNFEPNSIQLDFSNNSDDYLHTASDDFDSRKTTHHAPTANSTRSYATDEMYGQNPWNPSSNQLEDEEEITPNWSQMTQEKHLNEGSDTQEFTFSPENAKTMPEPQKSWLKIARGQLTNNAARTLPAIVRLASAEASSDVNVGQSDSFFQSVDQLNTELNTKLANLKVHTENLDTDQDDMNTEPITIKIDLTYKPIPSGSADWSDRIAPSQQIVNRNSEKSLNDAAYSVAESVWLNALLELEAWAKAAASETSIGTQQTASDLSDKITPSQHTFEQEIDNFSQEYSQNVVTPDDFTTSNVDSEKNTLLWWQEKQQSETASTKQHITSSVADWTFYQITTTNTVVAAVNEHSSSNHLFSTNPAAWLTDSKEFETSDYGKRLEDSHQKISLTNPFLDDINQAEIDRHETISNNPFENVEENTDATDSANNEPWNQETDTEVLEVTVLNGVPYISIHADMHEHKSSQDDNSSPDTFHNQKHHVAVGKGRSNSLPLNHGYTSKERVAATIAVSKTFNGSLEELPSQTHATYFEDNSKWPIENETTSDYVSTDDLSGFSGTSHEQIMLDFDDFANSHEEIEETEENNHLAESANSASKKSVSWSDLTKGEPLEMGPHSNEARDSPVKPIIKPRSHSLDRGIISHNDHGPYPVVPPRPSFININDSMSIRRDDSKTRLLDSLEEYRSKIVDTLDILTEQVRKGRISLSEQNPHVEPEEAIRTVLLRLLDGSAESNPPENTHATTQTHATEHNAQYASKHILAEASKRPALHMATQTTVTNVQLQPTELAVNTNFSNQHEFEQMLVHFESLLKDLEVLLHERNHFTRVLQDEPTVRAPIASSTHQYPGMSSETQRYLHEYREKVSQLKSELDSEIETAERRIDGIPMPQYIKNVLKERIFEKANYRPIEFANRYRPRMHQSPFAYREQLVDIRRNLVSTYRDFASSLGDPYGVQQGSSHFDWSHEMSANHQQPTFLQDIQSTRAFTGAQIHGAYQQLHQSNSFRPSRLPIASWKSHGHHTTIRPLNERIDREIASMRQALYNGNGSMSVEHDYPIEDDWRKYISENVRLKREEEKRKTRDADM